MGSGTIFWTGGGEVRVRTDSALLALCVLRDVVLAVGDRDDDYNDLITAVDEYMWTSISIDRFVVAVGGEWRLAALLADWTLRYRRGDPMLEHWGRLPSGGQLPASGDPEHVCGIVRLLLLVLMHREGDAVSDGVRGVEFIMGRG